MVRFDRTAYLDRLSDLAGKAMQAQFVEGLHSDDRDGASDRAAARRSAHAAFLAALYELPREFDGKRVSAGATSAKAEAR